MDLDEAMSHASTKIWNDKEGLKNPDTCCLSTRGPLVFWSVAPDGAPRRVVSLEDGRIVEFDSFFDLTEI